MKRPRLPFEELTDPANQNVLAYLKGRSWNLVGTSRNRARSYIHGRLAERMYNLGTPDDFPELPNPLEWLMELAMQTSGSIGGKHRENITDAIKGAQAPKMGLVASMESDGGRHEDRGI